MFVFLYPIGNKTMKPIKNLMSYLRRAFTEVCPETDEAHAIALLKALKSSPSILGDEVIVEEPFPVDQFTEAQKRLMAEPFFTPYSDAVEHLCTYSDEECRLMETAGTLLSSMNATDVRDEARVRSALPMVVEYRKMEARRMGGICTSILLKFKLETPAPLRVVKAPFSAVSPSLAMMVQRSSRSRSCVLGAHMTVTDPEAVRQHVSMCSYFIATFSVGFVDSFNVTIERAYRGAHFPGVRTEPDHACRLLTRCDLRGEDLKEAYEDFENAYGDDDEDNFIRHRVPVLLQRKDFIRV